MAQSPCKGGRYQCTLRAQSPTTATKIDTGPEVPGLENLGLRWASIARTDVMTLAAGPDTCCLFVVRPLPCFSRLRVLVVFKESGRGLPLSGASEELCPASPDLRKGKPMGLSSDWCVLRISSCVTCLASSPGDIIMCDRKQITLFR